MFSVNILVYGDHSDLAERCLSSISRVADWSLIADVRIGLNDVVQKTLSLVRAFGMQCRSPVYLCVPPRNVGKYPLMRRMFNDSRLPSLADRVMWFDDDSYIRDTVTTSWWRGVHQLATDNTVVGSLYDIRQRGLQWQEIPKQPWYTGKPVGPRHRYRFATGGWWVIDTAIVRRWDYPFPELHNNGGDSILGELCRQQSYKLLHFNTEIAINANATSVESAAKRRGETTPWVWQQERTGSSDLVHQNFDVTVEKFQKGDCYDQKYY